MTLSKVYVREHASSSSYNTLMYSILMCLLFRTVSSNRLRVELSLTSECFTRPLSLSHFFCTHTHTHAHAVICRNGNTLLCCCACADNSAICRTLAIILVALMYKTNVFKCISKHAFAFDINSN